MNRTFIRDLAHRSEDTLAGLVLLAMASIPILEIVLRRVFGFGIPAAIPIVRHLSLALEPPGVAEVPDRSSIDERVAALVADHFAFIWRLLRRSGLGPSDADDAAQHVFMTAAQKLDRIRPGKERTFLYGEEFLLAVRRALAARLASDARRSRDHGHQEVDPLRQRPGRADPHPRARPVLVPCGAPSRQRVTPWDHPAERRRLQQDRG